MTWFGHEGAECCRRVEHEISHIQQDLKWIKLGLLSIDEDLEKQNRKILKILAEIEQIVALLSQKPTWVVIQGDFMPLQVGSTSIATVVVLDQTGNPMSYDFSANPPSWSETGGFAGLSAGTSPDTQTLTGVGVGTGEVVSVSVPGVANPSASITFDVVAAAQVATSVRIDTNPPVA